MCLSPSTRSSSLCLCCLGPSRCWCLPGRWACCDWRRAAVDRLGRRVGRCWRRWTGDPHGPGWGWGWPAGCGCWAGCRAGRAGDTSSFVIHVLTSQAVRSGVSRNVVVTHRKRGRGTTAAPVTPVARSTPADRWLAGVTPGDTGVTWWSERPHVTSGGDVCT